MKDDWFSQRQRSPDLDVSPVSTGQQHEKDIGFLYSF